MDYFNLERVAFMFCKNCTFCNKIDFSCAFTNKLVCTNQICNLSSNEWQRIAEIFSSMSDKLKDISKVEKES